MTTYNWKEALELVLLSAIWQSRAPDEILVADDGSDEDTRAVVDAIREMTSIPINHVWHEDDGWRKSTIQNLALQQATGEYIVRIDGDIVMHRRFIEDHERFAQEGCYLQGYRHKLDEAETEAIFASKDVTVYPSLKGLFSSQRTFRSVLMNRFMLPKLSMKRIIGCNTSFWKSDAFLVNGFNEDMVGWSAEDQEFAARLMHNGIKQKRLSFCARVYHLHHEYKRSTFKKSSNKVFRSTLANKTKRCANGIEKLSDNV